jgi:hypothetical protein
LSWLLRRDSVARVIETRATRAQEKWGEMQRSARRFAVLLAVGLLSIAVVNAVPAAAKTYSNPNDRNCPYWKIDKPVRYGTAVVTTGNAICIRKYASGPNGSGHVVDRGRLELNVLLSRGLTTVKSARGFMDHCAWFNVDYVVWPGLRVRSDYRCSHRYGVGVGAVGTSGSYLGWISVDAASSGNILGWQASEPFSY